MILTKSKIYEERMFLPEICGKNFKQEYLENMKNKYWDSGMACVVLEDHERLISFFILKGADFWSQGMANAAKRGHEKLIDFFISKGANCWNWGMISADDGGRENLVQYFISRGANSWEWLKQLKKVMKK